ncbi:MAG: insulinase family protein, partial [Candidatus Omnitrophica bacterium]|nr:insulinase family protein [Candidatus Omnitrophota bacterium]
MYKKINLKNRVSVILDHMPHMESASVGVWVAAGSENEDAKVSGISHFLEHMIFKGTPTRSTRKIKQEIEGRGGSLNGFTSEEVTCYLAKVSGRHADIALSVLSDMVLHASMDKKDIERERTVIIEEIKMYRDLPN